MGAREPFADGGSEPDLFEHSPDPTLRYGPGAAGPVVRAVNPAFETAFGGTVGEPVGQPLRRVLAALGVGDGSAQPEDGDDRTDTGAPAERGTDPVAAARAGERAAGDCRPSAGTADRYRYRVIPAPPGESRGFVRYTPVPADAGAGVADDGRGAADDDAGFAAAVAHDLRNPLEVAEMRLDAARDTGDTVHFEKTAGALERIERLVDEVLALPDGEVDHEPVALAEAAAAAWDTVDTADATLVTAGAAGLTVAADPARLRRLFENLFRNAVEHAGADAIVTVGGGPVESDGEATATDGERVADTAETGSRGAADRVRFWVADDGPGIPPDERERVFRAGSSGDGGSGLGLAIVARVARAHGWSVSVTESEAGGARFEFTGVERAAE